MGAVLAADEQRFYEGGNLDHDERLDMEPAKVFVGSALEWDTGGANGVQPFASGGNKFAGFAKEQVNNLSTAPGGGTKGNKQVTVARQGIVHLNIESTIATTSVGAKIYATVDDNSFTLSSTSNTEIGEIVRVITTGTTGANLVAVKFYAAGFHGS